MEQLHKNLLFVRKSALHIVLVQILITLIVSLFGLIFFSPTVFLSLLLGGGTGSLASLIMALISFRVTPQLTPSKYLNRFYIGEFYKLLITIICFAMIFSNLHVNFIALMIGLIFTLLSYRLALYKPLMF